MTKPWDETWSRDGVRVMAMRADAESEDDWAEQVADVKKSIGDVGTRDWPAAEARADIIAQAPAMARLLCRLEWSACHLCGPSACPACVGLNQGGHAPGCALDACLTAIGISPEERESVRSG